MGKSGMNEIEEDTAKETGMQEQGRKNKHKRNKDKGQKLSARDVTKLLKWVIILAVVVILVVVGYKLAKQLGWFGLKPKVETTILTSSQLEQVLQIDDLSVCEITYNGVAEVPQKNHPTKVAYYVSYEAEVKASINMADIDVQIDDNVGEGQAKKIIVTLPQLQVKQIDVDMLRLTICLSRRVRTRQMYPRKRMRHVSQMQVLNAGEMKCSYRWRKKIVRIQSRHCSCRS